MVNFFLKYIFNIKKLSVLIFKIKNRFINRDYKKKYNLKWIKKNEINLEDYLNKLDSNLYNESITFQKYLNKHSKIVLDKINFKLGGGGNYTLLYFLSKYVKPNIVFETGVAAGFSSFAILKALEENKSGLLFSSDFPYFRIDNSEKYIGILVDKQKYNNWNLQIEGDQNNIPLFLKKIKNNNIDLFHYDSDKSYNGKKNTFELLKNNISFETIIIIDDIQDDTFFYDYVKENKREFKIFKFENKYLGLICNF
tara:strand:+ start:715 stop:1473 length:759 start_codon:yes stop_codon:yes gene_type:complete